MSLDHINFKKIRKSFGKIPLVTSLPNLVEVQKRSFDSFLQLRTEVNEQGFFYQFFPIHSSYHKISF